MAMSILNNSATAMALGETNKNTNKLGKALKKVSSGMKINSAGDSAAEYSISEKMRANIRALQQDIDNVHNGMNLINIAEGGIQNIVDSLRTMKELALNSANDHNTDFDRAILQKEFSSKMANIDDIAVSTNYNNQILLDGRYSLYSSLSKDTEKKYNIKISELDTEQDYFYNIAEHDRYMAEVLNSNDLPVTGCTKTVKPTSVAGYALAGTNCYVSEGIFDLSIIPDDGKTYTIIATGNVEIKGNGSVRNNIYIQGSNGGNLKLWLNNVNIVKTSENGGPDYCEKPIIGFDGGNNELILLGKSSIINECIPNVKLWHPLIDVGDSLTISNGDENNEGRLWVNDRVNVSGLYIGFAAGIGSYDNKNAYINIESGTLGISTVYGAAIGSAAGGQVGDINITGGHIIANTVAGAAAIGSGTAGIYIPGKTISAGNISISGDAIVDVMAAHGAGIGAGVYCDDTYYQMKFDYKEKGEQRTKVGNISITSDNVRSYSNRGEAIGSGPGAGIATGGKYDDGYMVRTDSWDPIYGLITADEEKYLDKFLDTNNKERYHLYLGKGMLQKSEVYEDEKSKNVDGTPLIIHYGPKSSQHLQVFINDMHSSAMGLETVCVDPSEEALKAIDKLDLAIEYALNENIRMGAYQSRLEYIMENLTTVVENNISAESVIRDADMAKEMMEYAKTNVLSQSSQAMLAQSNQKVKDVFSLLQ